MDHSTSQDEAFSLLGVASTASASDVRLAFRKAALKYHPDLFEGDSSEASAAFCRLVEAYRRAMQSVARRAAGPRRAVSPQELANMDAQPGQWDFVSLASGRSILQPRLVPPGTKVRSVPTLHEPRAFNFIWIAAMLASVGTMAYLAQRRSGAWVDGENMLMVILLPLGLYAAFLLGGLGLLMLTRKCVYLVLRFRRQRFLPAPKMLPRRSLLGRLLGRD